MLIDKLECIPHQVDQHLLKFVHVSNYRMILGLFKIVDQVNLLESGLLGEYVLQEFDDIFNLEPCNLFVELIFINLA